MCIRHFAVHKQMTDCQVCVEPSSSGTGSDACLPVPDAPCPCAVSCRLRTWASARRPSAPYRCGLVPRGRCGGSNVARWSWMRFAWRLGRVRQAWVWGLIGLEAHACHLLQRYAPHVGTAGMRSSMASDTTDRARQRLSHKPLGDLTLGNMLVHAGSWHLRAVRHPEGCVPACGGGARPDWPRQDWVGQDAGVCAACCGVSAQGGR